MSSVRILVADNVSLSGLKLLSSGKYDVTERQGISNEEILRDFPDVDVLLIRSTRKLDGDFISRCSIGAIATFTKGTDHIDTVAAELKGVRVINADEGNHISAAEHTMALMLSLFKNLRTSAEMIAEGKFQNTDFRRNELKGKTIFVIGFGKVGSCVAGYCRAFGMNIIANDIDKAVTESNPEIHFLDIDQALGISDVVTLHIPFNMQNNKFFSREKFVKMKESSFFINTSRGGVVDEEALIETLEKGRIAGAGLDVFMNEPDIDSRFAGLKNVVLSNHTAGKTVESRDRISEIIFRKIGQCFQ